MLQEAYGKNETTAQLQKYSAMAKFCSQVSFKWRQKEEGPFLAQVAGVVEHVRARQLEALRKGLNKEEVFRHMDQILVSCNRAVLFWGVICQLY